ncbi:MAG: aminotransferase class I/II-fold pyridoxal phosphate-dependent enzyme, partial [Rhodospirillaceae bacterium]|nr:aminotransferase class I/II-fold pyridoxal phosphate-dependent enzyme [Rhodospirillaceae bacterium]
MTHDPALLDLEPEEMRRLGYRMVDMVVDHWAHMSDKPAAVDLEVADIRPRLREPLPEAAGSWETALEKAQHDVFESMGQIAHPRFLAFVPGPSNPVAALADIMTSGYNTAASLWRETPGPVELELTTLEWVKELCGLQNQADGVFTSGGSVANMIGLAVARDARLAGDMNGAVIYCTDQTHSCVARGLRILGFQPEQLHAIPVDSEFSMDLTVLRAAINSDRVAGKRPFAIVANAGTTNTGSVDDLNAIADLAAEQDLWVHVDGAYGGAGTLSQEGQRLMAGMERADSVVIDPHKWLFQPYEAGICFVRDAGLMGHAFASNPEYLQDVAEGEDEVNFSERGIQLSRGLRAFKLWLSLKVFGAEAYRAAVERGVQIAREAEAMLLETGRFEIVTPAKLAVVTFRLLRDGLDDDATDRMQRAVVDALLKDGYAFVTSTELNGQTCLRFCTINPRITNEDLAGTIKRIIRFGDAAS